MIDGLSRDNGEHYVGRHFGGAVDALGCGDEVGGGGLIDAGDIFLRVAVDDGEPGGLHLQHDAMSLEKYVIVIAQGNVPVVGMVGFEGLRMLVAMQETTAADFYGDGQFISVERIGVAGGLVRRNIVGADLTALRVDVDQLDDEVGIGAGGGGVEGGGDGAGDDDIMIERRALKGEDVGAMLDEALIGDFPGGPLGFRVGG